MGKHSKDKKNDKVANDSNESKLNENASNSDNIEKNEDTIKIEEIENNESNKSIEKNKDNAIKSEKNVKKEKHKNIEKRKTECNKDIVTNMIYAVMSISYFIALNIVYQNCAENIFKIYMQVSYMLYLVLAIIQIEIAYKKNNYKIALYGVEYIIIAIYILLIEQITKTFNLDVKVYITFSSYIFPIYYTLKSIIIYTKQQTVKLKNLSDIEEIVKAEKPSKKVAKKRKV